MPRLTARSAGASADVALLRAARTDPAGPETPASPTLRVRLRGLTTLRGAGASTPAPLGARQQRRGA